MKKLVLLSILGLGGGLAAVVTDGIAAKVNDNVITFGEVFAEVRRSPGAWSDFTAAAHDRARLDSLYREAVNALIDRRLILAAAAEKKMEMQEWVVDNRVREIIKERFHGDRNELEAELQRNNMPFEEWRNLIREDLILAGMRYQIVDRFVNLSPGAMRREYDDHRDRYSLTAKTSVRVILLKPDDANPVTNRASAIRAALKDPKADFAALAREYSSDSHAKDGGLWSDTKPEDAFRPEIAAAIAALAPNEVSDLIELDGYGFILKKEAATAARRLSFDEAYDRIARNVRHDQTERAYRAWMDRLRAESFVKIYPQPER